MQLGLPSLLPVAKYLHGLPTLIQPVFSFAYEHSITPMTRSQMERLLGAIEL